MRRLVGFLGLILLVSCTKKPAESNPTEPLKDRGKRIYLANCIACHNADPRKPGPIGPEIFASNLELLKARVLEAKYPPGYKPKRVSQAMPATPHLEPELPALEAFLAAP